MSTETLFPNKVKFTGSQVDVSFWGTLFNQYMRGPLQSKLSERTSLRKWCLRSHVPGELELTRRRMNSGPTYEEAVQCNRNNEDALKGEGTQWSE